MVDSVRSRSISQTISSPSPAPPHHRSPRQREFPVEMMSPGSSVMIEEAHSMVSGMRKIMSAVLPCCRSSPFTHNRMSSACGSGISSAVTIHGPQGANPSNHLPASQSKNRSCSRRRRCRRSRVESPLAKYRSAPCSRTRAPWPGRGNASSRRPITTASSTSHPTETFSRVSSRTSSNGPLNVVEGFRKN